MRDGDDADGARRPDRSAQAAAWGEAAEIAYSKALDLILHGDVPPGGRLRENYLAELTGVSRTPVRQALNRLAAEGVVRLSRNRGAQVVELTDEDARGLLDLRARFEPYATRLAVDHMTEADLDRLTDLARQMEQLTSSTNDWNPVTMSRLNNEFHGVLIGNCGNRHLIMALQSVVMPATVARTFDRYTPEAMRRSMAHHAEIIDAARAGDGEWAGSVMRTHILAARHAFPTARIRVAADRGDPRGE
jgi:DNA-binding GntR family transcriptional regulator